jgi:hypothetical protein
MSSSDDKKKKDINEDRGLPLFVAWLSTLSLWMGYLVGKFTDM